MRLLVFGATGGTGRQVTAQALQAGHDVTIVVRNPAAVKTVHARLTIIKGDVFDCTTFDVAMKNQDAVISCLGIQKREVTTVYSQGIRHIIEVMQNKNVTRLICLSAGAVIVPPKGSASTRFFIRNILQHIFHHLYSDMLVMEKILDETDLNWTIIRPPWLRDTRLTGNYRTAINAHLDRPTKLSRADLAHYIVHHLNDEKTLRARIEISY